LKLFYKNKNLRKLTIVSLTHFIGFAPIYTLGDTLLLQKVITEDECKLSGVIKGNNGQFGNAAYSSSDNFFCYNCNIVFEILKL